LFASSDDESETAPTPKSCDEVEGFYKDLCKCRNDVNKWSCTLKFEEVDICISNKNQPNVFVNLCDYLIFKTDSNGYPPKTMYMFPEKYIGIDAKDLLVKDLQRAAVRNGFPLVTLSTVKDRSPMMRNYDRLLCIRKL
jgi:hypothetical protein